MTVDFPSHKLLLRTLVQLVSWANSTTGQNLSVCA